MAVEAFPLDRVLDERGRPLKDVSHEGSRWMNLSEVEALLSVSKEKLGTDLLYAPPAGSPWVTARMHLESLDTDRSGRLEGEEYERGGGRGVDLDGDGRITLDELGRSGSPDVPAAAKEEYAPELRSRTSRDGDLALLLDGVDPFSHDQDQSGSLTRSEAEAAFFDALDLDGDQGLTRDELSRCPGELRQLRFGDAQAQKLFERADRNKDRRITPREFRLEDAEWSALDADGSGDVRLVAPPFEEQRRRGHVLAGSEWPARRSDMIFLSPGITIETVLKAFDRDGDENLEARELKARPDLLKAFDGNLDQRAERAEIARLINRLDEVGVDMLPDDFLGRWDLDRSGAVEERELPESARVRLGVK
jgi:Ca2+-binding EF-hand superfamily protein